MSLPRRTIRKYRQELKAGTHRRAGFVRCFAAWLLAVAFCGSSAVAQGPYAEQQDVINREYAIKAAYLYHFSTYIQWPDEMLPTKRTRLSSQCIATIPLDRR